MAVRHVDKHKPSVYRRNLFLCKQCKNKVYCQFK